MEYTIHRGVLGATKELQHVVLEYRGDPVQPGRRSKFDSSQSLVLPAMPTTLVGVCRLINVYYALHVSLLDIVEQRQNFRKERPWSMQICLPNMQVSLLLESEAEDLTMEFPVTIATVPFRIPNSPNQPVVYYGTPLFPHFVSLTTVSLIIQDNVCWRILFSVCVFRTSMWTRRGRSIRWSWISTRSGLRRWADHFRNGCRTLSPRLRLR